jgi:hypothetical protein
MLSMPNKNLKIGIIALKIEVEARVSESVL